MSRLDDELRLAFSREEPSIDFTKRVIEQINTRTAPKKAIPKRHWWEPILALFEPLRVRWLAAGLALLVLLVIGAFQYWPDHTTSPEQQAVNVERDPAGNGGGDKQAGNQATAETGNTHANDASNEDQPVEGIARHRETGERNGLTRPERHRPRIARRPSRPDGSGTDLAVKSEGEIAKEKLMLALHIASETLSEAQKAVNGGDE